MAAFHLCDAGLELAESIVVHHGRQRGISIFWGWLSPKTESCTNHKCGWPRGRFYYGPTVGAKCTYPNLEWTGDRVDCRQNGLHNLQCHTCRYPPLEE